MISRPIPPLPLNPTPRDILEHDRLMREIEAERRVGYYAAVVILLASLIVGLYSYDQYLAFSGALDKWCLTHTCQKVPYP